MDHRQILQNKVAHDSLGTPTDLALRWLKQSLVGRHNHSISLDAIIMDSKYCLIFGEHAVIIFVTE